MKYGIYGKLPAHGDFISRNLPQNFIDIWDEWLQCVLAGSRDMLREEWLELYLTSPIWRFTLSPGVIDGQAWAGILVPSVDSVGRYFPLTLTVAVPARENLYSLISESDSWFAELESIAIAGLQEQQNVDYLYSGLEGLAIPVSTYQCSKTANGSLVSSGSSPSGSSPSGNSATGFAAMMSMANENVGSASVWAAPGNENMSATCFVASGLPVPDEYTCMLTGEW